MYEITQKWLPNALDIGISENDFWEMTFGELERAAQSHLRTKKREAQEKASYDYALADLIGRSVARIYSSTATYPDISEIYPTIFDSKEIAERKKQQQMELSAMRFKQFAASYNNRFKGGGKDK